jgi:hypothetical protein
LIAAIHIAFGVRRPGAFAPVSQRLVEQAEFNQFAHRARQHIDADAERLQRRQAFEDEARHADLCRLSASVNPPIPPTIRIVMAPPPDLIEVMAQDRRRGQLRRL